MCKMQGTGLLDSRYLMLDTGCRIQVTGDRLSVKKDTGSSHFGFWNAGFGLKKKVKDAGYGMRILGWGKTSC